MDEHRSRLVVGVIGGGTIAEVAHLPAYTDHPSVDRVTVAEPRNERRAALQRQFDLAPGYATGDALLESERPDIVSICTPPDTHESLFVDAAAHVDAIYCEKPLAVTVAAAERMAEVAATNDLITQVGYTHPYIGNFRRSADIVRNGLLGQVHGVTTHRVSEPPGAAWHYDATTGGVISDLAPHELDYYMRLFGEAPSIDTVAARRVGTNDVEDYCVAEMTAAGTDIRMLLSWGHPSTTRHPPPTLHKHDLVGDAGWLEADSECLEGKLYGQAIGYRHGQLPLVDLFSRYTLWGRTGEDVHGKRITGFIDHVVRNDRQTTAPVERGVTITRLVREIQSRGAP